MADLSQTRCGTCRLWGANFYQRLKSWPVNNTCAADAVMDLPASFIPARQTMQAWEGANCICWEPSTHTAAASSADHSSGIASAPAGDAPARAGDGR